ncbi:MAG TPA: trypsin-like peptidase domain-containing protein [Candidatus Hydrogenedentes bacterium]|nr:trypsin-like peptidase domain-containing protein [Candidatus Hydrogenedentota bacterium]HOL76702.1 trypsin-like peptidase domain-containing protein [Candidatus Hydrogenedentota bacterium]HPO85337.1 trypsin-like peptidase domain-containing protein [Candidatus Hydrogenedentota bacterium]
MKQVAFLISVAVVLSSGCATLAPSQDAAVIRAKEKVAPALVHIRPVKEVFTEGKREEVLVIGSGFIISPDGYVVTNEHVAGSSRVVNCVLYTKEEMEAEVVGVDRYTDIAVLKLKTDRRDFPSVKLGSSSSLRAGETVLALGSPHGLARSVSKGIVSVPDRYLSTPDFMDINYNNWIQTDAAINPGNSGGPLVNLRGEVVGINARRLGGAENVGFAIPIDVAKEVIQSILKNGRMIRGWIGLSFQELSRKTGDVKQEGVVVADVEPLSPAAEVGIRPGDILLSVNGKPTTARFIEDLPVINKLIADLPIDQPATLHLLRGDQALDVEVKPEERSDVVGKEVEFPEWGFTATELTPELARRAQISSRQGVLVSGIQVGGLAAAAELGRGDIILKVDDAEVTDLETFSKLYRERVDSKKRLVLLDIRRGALMRYILIKQETESTNGQEP